jgi:hypothetical protein
MTIFNKTLNGTSLFSCDSIITSLYPDESIVIFDIETTGFSPKTTSVYLIGAFYVKDESLTLTQWFCDEPSDEAEVLQQFIGFLSGFDVLMTYNGDGFDIPYLSARCAAHGINFDFSALESIDIYKCIRSMNKLLKLTSCRQTFVEERLGIRRDDMMDGGRLVEVYRHFAVSPTEDARQLMLLHNHDDVLCLAKVAIMLNYRQLVDGSYEVSGVEPQYDDGVCSGIMITCVLGSPIPIQASLMDQSHYLTCQDRSLKLFSKVYCGTLRHFYTDYDNYYYLPDEDVAIHKSVAAYVDREHRQRANAHNCYKKIEGTFLPQYAAIVSPDFKLEYSSKSSYFQLDDAFLGNASAQKQYVGHVLQHML